MLYFVLYLFLEVMVSVNLSSQIGGFNTFLELIGSAFFGFVLLVNFRSTLFENMQAFSAHRIDVKEFQQLNIFAVIGAILLIIPGFLTDIIGVLLQFSVITKMLVNRFTAKSTYQNDTRFDQTHSTLDTQKDDDVIDVEIISNDSTK